MLLCLRILPVPTLSGRDLRRRRGPRIKRGQRGCPTIRLRSPFCRRPVPTAAPAGAPGIKAPPSEALPGVKGARPLGARWPPGSRGAAPLQGPPAAAAGGSGGGAAGRVLLDGTCARGRRAGTRARAGRARFLRAPLAQPSARHGLLGEKHPPSPFLPLPGCHPVITPTRFLQLCFTDDKHLWFIVLGELQT